MQYGHEVAVQYRELLQLVMHILNKPTSEVSVYILYNIFLSPTAESLISVLSVSGQVSASAVSRFLFLPQLMSQRPSFIMG
jgi:hypothetical protein